MTEEQARDAHLREALRHAPDAQVQPPAALSALILSEAHAKARNAATPAWPKPTGLRALWGWLARPAVATGFAGVMAATLVGLMWWDQPMDEALPRRPAPATAAAPPPAVAMAPTAAPPVAPPVQAPAAEAKRAAAPPAPRAALRQAAPEADQAPAKNDKQEVAAQAAKPDAQAAAPPAPVADARKDATPVAREAVAPTAPPPAPAPAPSATAGAAANTSAAAAAGAGAGALAKSKLAEESKRTRSVSASADALRNNAAAPAEASEVRQAHREAQAPPLIATVRSAIAAEPARWGWQRDGGTVQDMSDAVYAWLAQLDSAAGTAWQPRAARDTTAPAPLGPELKLLRDGRVMHSLRLTERGVLWERGQSSWQAELPLSTLQALERSAP